MKKAVEAGVRPDTKENKTDLKSDADELDDADLETVAGGVTWHPDSDAVKSNDWQSWTADI